MTIRKLPKENRSNHTGTQLAATISDLAGLICINVKDKGALGDGVADDTTAIQTAIDNSSAGSVIFFPAGTYLISSMIRFRADGRAYVGGGQSTGSAAVIKQKNSANITDADGISGLFVDNVWYNNGSFVDTPVRIENIKFDGNKANNLTSNACGIVMLNFWSTVRDCYVINAPSHGIRLTDVTRNGGVISNSAAENRVSNNRIENVGGSGISQTSQNGDANLDGFCEANLIVTVGSSGIDMDRAAGWLIRGNHIYGTIPLSGIKANNSFATTITNNYIEQFGDTNASGGFYNGINCTVLDGWGAKVTHNLVSCLQAGASSTYQYVSMSAGNGQTTATGVLSGNMMIPPASPLGSAIGIVLDTNGGGAILNVAVSDNVNRVSGAAFVTSSVRIIRPDASGQRLRAVTNSTTARTTGAAQGTSPPATTGTVNDYFGTYNFGSGTSTTTGSIGGITFSVAYPAAPPVTLTPGNAATAALGLYATPTTSGFTIGCTTAPTASQAAGTYVVHYQVGG